MGPLVSRRDLLRYGTGAAAALALPWAGVACARDKPSPTTLPQPRVVSSRGGVLAVTLTAMRGVVEMGAPSPVSTYTYDGIVPGNTWEVHPGDVLEIDLVNQLPPTTEHQHTDTPPRPHLWTNTNLHTHGLHVSPAGDGDNVFVDIPPGGQHRYRIPVPHDHTGGIFWYHPHRHGAVTQQVRGGMAGLIVVRGAIDNVEEVRAAWEQIMVLQSIELGDGYQLLDPIPDPTTQEAFFPRTQVLYTINGVLKPTITMYPGEVQRWRILNAAEGKFMSLALQGHDFHVLAWDGLTLHAPEPDSVVMLAAGSRVELLVKAGRPGSYDLVLTPGSSQKPDIPGMPDTTTSTVAPSTTTTLGPELRPCAMATIEVAGTGRTMSLPTALPAFDPPMPPIAKTLRYAFTVERLAGGEFVSFGIDGIPFDPDRPPHQMKLGTAEEWTLVNQLDTRLPRHAHGLHIHVNPYKITHINGVTLPRPLWRDTFVLTGANGDSITFQTHFEDFTGKFVQHCHVLSHEDLGMMEALEVIP